MTLDKLEVGSSAKITVVGGEGSLRQHFLDMGVIPGAMVKLTKLAPMGDPMELQIHGYSLSLRLAEAARIEVVETEPASAWPQVGEARCASCPLSCSCGEAQSRVGKRRSAEAGCRQAQADGGQERGGDVRHQWRDQEHPGLGEGGRYHSRDHENPLPKGTILTFALAGNQNCGKTTLFNQLTGSNHHVGNFPGMTVDCKDGVIRGCPDTLVTDLPGIYSLSPYTAEEIVSRQFIINDKPKGIINIVDAGNIERNLYLTMQLMELGTPMVLALNMMDEVRGNGGAILVNEMERMLGIPVVPISAARDEGIEELIEHAVHVAKYQEGPARQDFCDKEDYGGAVHRCLHGIMHLVEDHAEASGLPVRFAASRLVEGDKAVLERLKLSDNEKDMLEHIICQMEEERGLDRCAAMADMRFAFIRNLCARTVVKPRESRELKRSRRIDRVLTGRFTAIPLFVLIMSLVIYLSIDVLGAPLQELLSRGIGWLADVTGAGLTQWGVSAAVTSLVIDGVFGGVGTVVSFVPIIIILFFFLSMLEDSGYMSRVAFVTDKLLRKIGLSGRSIVPLMTGFGCSVPAVMASRTLPSARDRRLTILLTPYISCSAKIPVYAFFSSTFFPGHGGLVLVCLYLFAILVGIGLALLVKLMRKNSEAVPFVMEMPNYRLPDMKSVANLLWKKTKDFLQTAFTVIFVASIVIWVLQSFDFRLNLVDSQDSMLAGIAGLIAPAFAPLGLGDWRIVTALISGFLAKESVVSTLQVLGATSAMTALTAIPMLVFCLLYTPCVAAIAAVKRELGGKWAGIVIALQCTVAWVCALLVYLLAGTLF